MIQRILVNDLDFAPDQGLSGGIVVSHNVLPWLGIATTSLPDLAALAFQLLQLLPMLPIACVLLIWQHQSTDNFAVCVKQCILHPSNNCCIIYYFLLSGQHMPSHEMCLLFLPEQ